MKSKNIFYKILKISAAVFFFLVIILCVHIYTVTRTHGADASTIAMARIDIKQDINQEQADKVANWLGKQKGVDHVLVNPTSKTAVFSFYPIKANATEIANNLSIALNLKAERYMPTEEEMKTGCPVVAQAYTNKISKFFKSIF